MFPRGRFWAEKAKERADGTVDLVGVLERWLESASSENALEHASEALIEFGERRGIEILRRTLHANKASHAHLRERVRFAIQRGSLE
jgi:hypothetical protein